MASAIMNRYRRHVGLLLLLAAALVLPYAVTNRYYLQVIRMALIWAIATQGLNVILGYAGQLSLAQGGLFGIGAYTVGLLTTKAGLSFWVALPAAALLTGVVGYAVGLVSLRTRGHTFAIFTLCVGVIIGLVIEEWDSLTEGVRGLIGIPLPSPIPLPVVGPITFRSPRAQYYLVLLFFLLTQMVTYRLVHSLVGRTFQAIRSGEVLAESLGIRVMAEKRLAFVISAVLTGIAGGLYAAQIRFIGPEVSHFGVTFNLLLFLLVGGQGTVAGPLVGTLVVSLLTESLQLLQEYRMLIFGPILILIVMYFPKGLAGALADAWGYLGRRARASAHPLVGMATERPVETAEGRG
ncbi:branched-chain amino acid ABC transporter permease [Caldinitratiruptor microaerophilus]|uniref:Branched-chain amino acid ABC transporter permease n=1 Tax=Caldinitratiruptor microaerophilus TaxID=671077 RepID=A0AA35G873_9FIRM|nr:branched-chain amino acid ABC transporter permease [Caldinitratiruptor microaerophilus]BDG58984.1 branched-chain amino acid ABC transporter permease [Caldinitratiruptor microaerophilus]